MNEESDFINLESIISLSNEAKDLAILERNYQTVKNHPLYTVNKKSFSSTRFGNNNKERLDHAYKLQKEYLQSLENQKNNQVDQNSQNSKDLDEKLNKTTNDNNSSINEAKIKQYFQENNIYLITLKNDEELLVKYNNGEERIFNTASNQQLRGIANYLQGQNKRSINQAELEKLSLSSHKPNTNSDSPNYLL